MKNSNISRRTFIKQCVIGGVTVYSAPLLCSDDITSSLKEHTLKKGWKFQEKVRFRFDAIAKVTGEKIYGSDYRAQDIDSWPNKQSYGYILRVNKANRIFKGLNLSMLDEQAKPSLVITAKDLQQKQLDFPGFYGKDMLLSEGKTPLYLGHEVAILIFDDFLSFKLAKQKLQFNEDVIIYGRKSALAAKSRDPYATWRVIREEGKEKDLYSPIVNGLIFPSYIDHKPQWPKKGSRKGDALHKGIYYAHKLKDDFNTQDWYFLDKHYDTQSIDTHALEPESFNGYFQRETKTLHLVITSQSPGDFYQFAGEMISKSIYAKEVSKLIVHSPYIGGGFGGKDHTPYPYFGLIASLFCKTPIRLANDRYEQFQSGIKRHPFRIHNHLAFDKKTHKIKGFISDITVDGGGRENYSSSVTMVGVSAAQGIYYLPRNDINATCYPSQLPHAGSMRGYGSLQTMPAFEMMMNEASEALGVDPISLRKLNAMAPGQKNSQGAIPNGSNRYQEMLSLSEKHPIWKNRHTKKQVFEKENVGLKYGVGYSIVTKDYGTGANAPSTSLEIQEDGKIILKIPSMEMGTGTDSSQGLIVKEYLGSIADEIIPAEHKAFEILKLVETDDPHTITQQRQDEMQKNPRWTPVIEMSSAASQSSYYQTHTTKIAAKLLLEFGLYPAAIEIYQKFYFNTEYAQENFPSFEEVQWKDGQLSFLGYPPLSLKTLAKQAYKMGLLSGVVVHAFNRWAWANSSYMINGKKKSYFIDALALKYAKKEYKLLDRVTIDYPKTILNNAMVTYYTPCATLVELSVNEGTGAVNILKTHTFLEAGNIILKEFVEGQLHGGVAMGIGHALYEELPQTDKGAGNGTWNLNRYHLPRAKEVGVWSMEHTFLPPLSKSDPNKGMAEVVMIPIVAAIVEGIYQAIHKRFYHLPIKREDIVKEI